MMAREFAYTIESYKQDYIEGNGCREREAEVYAIADFIVNNGCFRYNLQIDDFKEHFAKDTFGNSIIKELDEALGHFAKNEAKK